jgi:hypothetical protein
MLHDLVLEDLENGVGRLASRLPAILEDVTWLNSLSLSPNAPYGGGLLAHDALVGESDVTGVASVTNRLASVRRPK